MGKVTAFESTDGQLFRNQADQIRHDDTLRLDAQINNMAATLGAAAPHVDDWNTCAYSSIDDMRIIVRTLLEQHPEELRNALDIQRAMNAPQVEVKTKPKKESNVRKALPVKKHR